jgi:hypothetical protein
VELYELQHIVRYKIVSTFEELVAVTQKYAKIVRLEQNDKYKKISVNAVTNTQTYQQCCRARFLSAPTLTLNFVSGAQLN